MADCTVATVLRSGGRYDPRWVRALAAGLEEHLPGVPLTVLTDLPEAEIVDVPLSGVRVAPLEHDWPGWWSKLELWRPGLFEGRVLYMDLDTLPVGDLAELAACECPVAVLRDFYQPEWPASGVMSWAPSEETEQIYHRFREVAAEGRYRARVRSDFFLRGALPDGCGRLQDLLPGQIVSLKIHATDGPPDDARLICGHGRHHRLSDPESGWAHELWRERAA